MKYTLAAFLVGMLLFPFATFAQSTPSNTQILQLIASLTQQVQLLESQLSAQSLIQSEIAALTKDMNAAIADVNTQVNTDIPGCTEDNQPIYFAQGEKGQEQIAQSINCLAAEQAIPINMAADRSRAAGDQQQIYQLEAQI